MASLSEFNGQVVLIPDALKKVEADGYLSKLREEVSWSNDEVKLFGKTHITERQVALMGDHGLSYCYSGVRRLAMPWSASVLKLKNLAAEVVERPFNSCLLNRYPSGASGMGWHSDNERELGSQPSIAVISLGAERPFHFKSKKDGIRQELFLPHGSLLIMKGSFQDDFLHALPKRKRIEEERISLTFRNILC